MFSEKNRTELPRESLDPDLEANTGKWIWRTNGRDKRDEGTEIKRDGERETKTERVRE